MPSNAVQHETTGAERLRQIVSILNKHNVIKGMTPEKLCAILQELGPTFVKLGQIMSMRPDMIPLAYCEELQKLRANVTPMPADEVRRVVEGSLHMPLEEAFSAFDFTSLGSASIAQVHKASLPDGRRVVVKVQREGIHDKMASDIGLLRKAARILKLTPTGETIDFCQVLEEMWVVSKEEMNFTTEACNLEEFARLNSDIQYVACPRVYRTSSTEQVLVMEQIEGVPIDQTERLKADGYDMDEIGHKLCVNYMKQVLDDGFFHADPHPGNLLIRGGQIVWLDLGMVGRLSKKDQQAFRKAASAAVARDTGGMVDAVLTIGKHTHPIDREALYADVDTMLAEYMEKDLSAIDLASTIEQVLELAKKHKISMPSGVTMLGRGITTIEGLIADICPAINIMEILSQRFAGEAVSDIDLKKTLMESSQMLGESARKSLGIPALISDTLRAAHKGELKLRVEQLTAQQTERAHEKRVRLACQTALICCGLLSSGLMSLAPAGENLWLGLNPPALIGFALTFVYAAWIFRKRKE